MKKIFFICILFSRILIPINAQFSSQQQRLDFTKVIYENKREAHIAYQKGDIGWTKDFDCELTTYFGQISNGVLPGRLNLDGVNIIYIKLKSNVGLLKNSRLRYEKVTYGGSDFIELIIKMNQAGELDKSSLKVIVHGELFIPKVDDFKVRFMIAPNMNNTSTFQLGIHLTNIKFYVYDNLYDEWQ